MISDRVPAMIVTPVTMPTIAARRKVHMRLKSGLIHGPEVACQRFEAKPGIRKIAIASRSGMISASMARTTTGRPMPIAPLTKPPMRTATTVSAAVVGSII